MIDVVGDFAAELMDGEELQIDGATMAIIMANAGDTGADGSLDAQFFVQFAGQGLLRALAGLDLAAGKLPHQGHGLIGTALADEDLTVTYDECRRYKTKGWTGGSSIGFRLVLFHGPSLLAVNGFEF